MSDHQEEFFGLAVMLPVQDENNNASFNWVVVNPELTVKNQREIEDGDFLELFDNYGRPLLRKQIYRDYDSYYNHQHRRQLHQGVAIKWAPKGIALDYWMGMFSNQTRARLVKG